MSRLFAGTPFDIPPQCDLCGKTEEECVCTPAEKAAEAAAKQRVADRIEPQQQTAQLRIEKRKGGRTATVVQGLTARANDLPALLSKLQTACGTGGTVKTKDGLIELQGDHLSAARDCLIDIGYRVR